MSEWQLTVEEPDYLDGIRSGLTVRSLGGRPVGYFFEADEATLAAAAPDMLDALKAFVAGCDHLHTAELGLARSAIAKATGQD